MTSTLAQTQALTQVPMQALTPENIYLCPLCKGALSLAQKTYRCPENHCFDLAKEGYVNLLPVQHKHSKDPGDNKMMVRARRNFLEQGFYQPLVEVIVQLYQDYGDNSTVFDAGCGEGFYTHQHKTATNQVYGIDIAKEAIKIAAKKYKACQFSVGTLANLPFSDESFNWLYSIYAPILEQEFTRVLSKGGYLLTVSPAENHLIELKQQIYQSAEQHDSSKEVIQQLTLVHQQRLSYQMTLPTGEDILNLLLMTPFAFKASEQVKTELADHTNFNCQADFMIRLYQKDAS